MQKSLLFSILLLWILVLVTGVSWKLMESDRRARHIPGPPAPLLEMASTVPPSAPHKTPPGPTDPAEPLLQYCNLPQQPITGEEGRLDDGVDLIGVIVLFRHGDRGPLTDGAVDGAVNCSAWATRRFEELQQAVVRSKLEARFPDTVFLPKSDRCLAGQLTKQGSSQLIELGAFLNGRYGATGGLDRADAWRRLAAHSTPYSRTLQSLRSLLFGLVGFDASLAVRVATTPDVSFCFGLCRCPAAKRYEKMHKRELASSTRSVRDARLSAPGLRATLAAAAGASRANRDVLASSVKDALLTYVCHRATPAWLTPPAARSVDDCLRHEARVSAGGAHLAMASLLKARGLLGRLDEEVSRWVADYGASDSESHSKWRPRFSFYSGHDLTLMYLLSALSLYDGYLPAYASRFVVEVLANGAAEFQVRLLWNGREVARHDDRFFRRWPHSEMRRQFGTDDFEQACRS